MIFWHLTMNNKTMEVKLQEIATLAYQLIDKGAELTERYYSLNRDLCCVFARD